MKKALVELAHRLAQHPLSFHYLRKLPELGYEDATPGAPRTPFAPAGARRRLWHRRVRAPLQPRSWSRMCNCRTHPLAPN